MEMERVIALALIRLGMQNSSICNAGDLLKAEEILGKITFEDEVRRQAAGSPSQEYAVADFAARWSGNDTDFQQVVTWTVTKGASPTYCVWPGSASRIRPSWRSRGPWPAGFRIA